MRLNQRHGFVSFILTVACLRLSANEVLTSWMIRASAATLSIRRERLSAKAASHPPRDERAAAAQCGGLAK
jgi:hypothetical protein